MARRMRIDVDSVSSDAVEKHLSKKQRKKLARTRDRRIDIEVDVDPKKAPQVARELNATILRS